MPAEENPNPLAFPFAKLFVATTEADEVLKLLL
jgi:hypothetical protein